MAREATLQDTINYNRDMQRYHEHMAQLAATKMLNASTRLLSSIYKDDIKVHESIARDYANICTTLQRERDRQ